MDMSTLLPSDFEEDRMFYMQVDPNSVLHYLLSLFYEKYSEGLGDWMYLMDLNENRLQLRLGKTPLSGFIMEGFQNVVRFYGLSMEGWLKLVYVGEDIFVVLKVKDYNMVKQPIPPNPMRGTICVNTNTLPYHDSAIYLDARQGVSMQPDHMEVNTPKLLADAYPFNAGPVLNGFPLTPMDQLGEGATFAPNTLFNSRVVTARDAARVSGIHGQNDGISVPNAGLSFTGFRNNSSVNLASLTRFYPKQEMNNPIDHVIHSMDFGLGENSAEITCTKRLTSNQIYSSCVIIPLRFAKEAFPSRHNSVMVLFGNKHPARMGLRWNTTHKTTVYLTRGWKYFAKINGFRMELS